MSDEHVPRDGTGGHKEIPGMFEGPILAPLVKLTFPIFFGMVFQILYNIVDTIWISRIDLADPSYVGGVGIVFPVFFFVIALASGIMIGTSSLVARSIGAKDKYVLDRTAESGLFIGLILAAVVLVLGYLFDERMLRLLGAKDDYFTHGLEYLRYILPAGAMMIVLDVFAGILMGEGLMKHIMYAMIISTMTNIALDPVFIFYLKMGVGGAGLATVVSQIVPFIYVFFLFHKKKTTVPIEWKPRNIKASIVKQIVIIGIPQSAGHISMAISFIFFNRLIMSIDPLALTAFSICGRFDYIILVPMLSFGSAMLTMIGQNFGRKNYRRVLDIWKVGLFTMLVVTAFLAGLLVLFASRIFPFFSTVDQVVRYAVLQTRIVEFSFVMGGIAIIAQSAFQGIGRALPGLVLTIIRIVGVSLPLAYILVYTTNLGIYGIWYGIIIGNVTSALVALFWVRKTFGSYVEPGISS